MTYASKSDTLRAAREVLKAAGISNAMSGVHFQLVPAPEGADAPPNSWTWHQIDLTSGQVATGELIKDGAKAFDVPPVTKCPDGAAAGVTAPKAAKKQTPPAPKTKAPATPKPQPGPGQVWARDMGNNRVIVDENSPLLVGKVVYPNKTRAAEARKAAEQAKATKVKAAAPKQPNRKQVAIEAAQRGQMPTAPDFSAETHKRFRKTLQQLVDYAKAGNLKGLKADKTEPKSSSRVALCRYRDLAIMALEAKAKAAKAQAKKAA